MWEKVSFLSWLVERRHSQNSVLPSSHRPLEMGTPGKETARPSPCPDHLLCTWYLEQQTSGLVFSPKLSGRLPTRWQILHSSCQWPPSPHQGCRLHTWPHGPGSPCLAASTLTQSSIAWVLASWAGLQRTSCTRPAQLGCLWYHCRPPSLRLLAETIPWVAAVGRMFD